MADEEHDNQYCIDESGSIGWNNPKSALALIVSRCIEDIDRIIEMAWEDRTPFEAIRLQFGLSEERVRKLMKQQLKFGAYKRWRKRVEACKTKHAKTRSSDIIRFKCDRQRAISQNKISKR